MDKAENADAKAGTCTAGDDGILAAGCCLAAVNNKENYDVNILAAIEGRGRSTM